MHPFFQRHAAPLCLLALLAALAQVPLAAAAETPVVATVNGDDITQDEVDRLSAERQAQPRRETKDVLTALVERLLFAQAAVARGALDLPALKADLDKALPFPLAPAYLPGTPMPEAATPQEQANTAAARAFLAGIYINARATSLPQIGAADVHAFYEKNPLLFSDRHIYTIKELLIDSPTPQADALVQSHIRSGRSIDELALALKASKIDFRGSQGTRNAEQAPMELLEFLNGMKLARIYKNPKAPAGLLSLFAMQQSTREPVTEEHAAPAIEQYLVNQRKNALINSEAEELRGRGSVILREVRVN